MLPGGHLGCGLWLCSRINHLTPYKHFDKVTLRTYIIAGFMSLLPDLIDKPLAIWIFPDLGTGWIIGHNFIVLLLLYFGLRLWTKHAMLVVFAFLHLALDLISHVAGWQNMFYPLFGPYATSTSYAHFSIWTFFSRLPDFFIERPHVAITEFFGILYCGYIFVSWIKSRSRIT